MLLFIIKLYVGLSSNSISIYSDGVNNFFDSLTGVLSFVMLSSLVKEVNAFSAFRINKTEQLLSFIISVTVAFTAFYFAYNSLERLTYPTPVTYSVRYLMIIAFTALIKLIMFAVLRKLSLRTDSKVVRLMSLDSLLDFFITAVTVITLLLSKDGKYTVDAFCGIGISVTILFTAVKNVLSSVRLLTQSPEKEKREKLEELLEDIAVTDISFNVTDETTEAYIKIQSCEEEKAQALSLNIENVTGIKVYFLPVKIIHKGE